MADQNVLNQIKRGALELVNETELIEKLNSGRQLVVKLGADPTSPDLHLGHSVVLNKMRLFQDLGHKAVLVIGDFTASIGDPSGRDSTRPVLTMETIVENAKTYQNQAFKILDPSKTEIVFNSSWLSPFIGAGLGNGKQFSGARNSEFLTALSHVTLSRILERDDFKKRIQEQNPISILEIMYPIFQAYDSVALKADIELGGSDQVFNLLMGRSLQASYKQERQVILTMPLLVGTDGVKKMSKSYGNYIGLTENAKDMFGKIMSVSDELMLNYYELLTNKNLDEIKAMHPMEAKKQLACFVVNRYHGEGAGAAARAEFEQIFAKHQLPDDMPEINFEKGTVISKIIVQAGFTKSRKEAMRLIDQGAVKLNNVKVDADIAPQGRELVLQAGRRHFCKITETGN